MKSRKPRFHARLVSLQVKLVAIWSQMAAGSVVIEQNSMTSLVIPIRTTPAGQNRTAMADMATPTSPAITEMTCSTFDSFM